MPTCWSRSPPQGSSEKTSRFLYSDFIVRVHSSHSSSTALHEQSLQSSTDAIYLRARYSTPLSRFSKIMCDIAQTLPRLHAALCFQLRFDWLEHVLSQVNYFHHNNREHRYGQSMMSIESLTTEKQKASLWMRRIESPFRPKKNNSVAGNVVNKNACSHDRYHSYNVP